MVLFLKFVYNTEKTLMPLSAFGTKNITAALVFVASFEFATRTI